VQKINVHPRQVDDEVDEIELSGEYLTRTVVEQYLSAGYQLEKLEVEFGDPRWATWGRCVWVKDHPAYRDKDMIDLGPKGFDPRLLYAFFNTENTSEQSHGLYSEKVFAPDATPGRVLLHEDVTFHRVVLSRQK